MGTGKNSAFWMHYTQLSRPELLEPHPGGQIQWFCRSLCPVSRSFHSIWVPCKVCLIQRTRTLGGLVFLSCNDHHCPEHPFLQTDFAWNAKMLSRRGLCSWRIGHNIKPWWSRPEFPKVWMVTSCMPGSMQCSWKCKNTLLGSLGGLFYIMPGLPPSLLAFIYLRLAQRSDWKQLPVCRCNFCWLEATSSHFLKTFWGQYGRSLAWHKP